jgi:DNA-directed RNA polymerase specialized sigma24 family protein
MQSELSQLLSRVRCGDKEAARQLVERFESAVRVAIRTRLSDPRLRRQFDSLDVCQSVLAKFFLYASSGAYDLAEPCQLLALLTRMAENKLGSRARDQLRQRRDIRRLSLVPVEETDVASHEPDPARQVENQELLARALGLMTPEIRDIAVRRMEGENWPKIAQALGGTPESRRKQFERAILPIAGSLDVSVSPC